MDVIQHLNAHHVNLADVAGYLVSVVLLWWPGSRFVRWWHDRFNARLVMPSRDMTLGGVEDAKEKVRLRLSMEFAGVIGGLEGLVYVLAVMINQYGLITSVIILKAFFGWVDMPRDAQQSDMVERKLDY